MISRMRYINRWGLMRNTQLENIQEHSHQVAVLAHALALIRREILKLDGPDPDKCAVAALSPCEDRHRHTEQIEQTA